MSLVCSKQYSSMFDGSNSAKISQSCDPKILSITKKTNLVLCSPCLEAVKKHDRVHLLWNSTITSNYDFCFLLIVRIIINWLWPVLFLNRHLGHAVLEQRRTRRANKKLQYVRQKAVRMSRHSCVISFMCVFFKNF